MKGFWLSLPKKTFKGWLGPASHSNITYQKHLYLPDITLFFTAALSEASEKLTLRPL